MVFPWFSYFFILSLFSESDVFPRFRLDVLRKNKKIQALDKFYVFLTQKLECMSVKGPWPPSFVDQCKPCPPNPPQSQGCHDLAKNLGQKEKERHQSDIAASSLSLLFRLTVACISQPKIWTKSTKTFVLEMFGGYSGGVWGYFWNCLEGF